MRRPFMFFRYGRKHRGVNGPSLGVVPRRKEPRWWTQGTRAVTLDLPPTCRRRSRWRTAEVRYAREEWTTQLGLLLSMGLKLGNGQCALAELRVVCSKQCNPTQPSAYLPVCWWLKRVDGTLDVPFCQHCFAWRVSD